MTASNCIDYEDIIRVVPPLVIGPDLAYAYAVPSLRVSYVYETLFL
jgi:hypothetical protein